MKKPLYDWEIEVNQEKDKLKNEFLRLYSNELNLNSRYIGLSERSDIKERYDLNDELIDEIIDESNQIYVNKYNEKFLNDFLNKLDSYDSLIDDKTREELHDTYNTEYNDYFKTLGMNNYINEHNNRIIENQKEILKSLSHDLEKYNRPINHDEIKNFKNKCANEDDEFLLKIKTIINNFNDRFIEEQFNDALNILRKDHGDYDLAVSDSEKAYLKVEYPDFYWDELIDKYHKEYFRNKSKSNITEHNVYYQKEYVRKDDWGRASSNQVRISKRILDYKDDNFDFVIDEFTGDMIKFIEFFSNFGLDSNFDKLYLIPIPSSTRERDKNSSMKKSINIIENKFQEGLLNFNENHEIEIVNGNGYLIRYIDIPPAHLSDKRPTYNDHIRTIKFNGKNISNSINSAFLLMDDITTSGTIMKACENILVKNGIYRDNIYKFAIGRTVYIQ